MSDPAGARRYRPEREGARRAARTPSEHRKRRRWWPLAALLAAASALAGLGIGAALWSDDEPEQRRPAATTTTTTAEPEPKTQPETTQATTPESSPSTEPRPVRMALKRLPGGRPGKGEVSLTPQGKGTALLDLTATFRTAQFSAYLVGKGRRKLLASARGGRLTYRKAVAVEALARRYDAIEIVAQRLPVGRRTKRVRSLRVSTSTLVKRLARRQADG